MLSCETVRGRERVGGFIAEAVGLSGMPWPPSNTTYAMGANGDRLVRERSMGWGISAPGAEVRPNTRESTAAALELALRKIANRWKPSIMLQLAAGPCRRRDIEQALPRHVSAKVLTEQLRALEADGLVYRADRTPAGHGRHVTYALTEFGQTLGPTVIALAEWAVTHHADLLRGRRGAVVSGANDR